MSTWRHRFKGHWHQETMWLAFAWWLCVSPFAFIVAAWFFGWQAGLGAVASLFLITLLVCWGICLWPRVGDRKE